MMDEKDISLFHSREDLQEIKMGQLQIIQVAKFLGGWQKNTQHAIQAIT